MSPRSFQDLTGKQFTRWVVIEISEPRNGQTYWLCHCLCGTIKPVAAQALLNGRSKSCRCLDHELFAARVRKHGFSYLPEFKIWRNMKSRCENPRDIGYTFYGGRGITVCTRWQVFENFLADMKPRPSPKHTIERKDNDFGYSPENCRWATYKEQNNNHRGNHLLTYKGRTLTITQWAEECGLKPVTLSHRINYSHWPVEKALTTPLRHLSSQSLGGKPSARK